MKAIVLMVMVSYRERKQIKSSQGRKCLGQHPGRFQTENFHCPLPVESGMLLSRYRYVTIHIEYCQPGMLTQASLVGVFIEAPLHKHD